MKLIRTTDHQHPDRGSGRDSRRDSGNVAIRRGVPGRSLLVALLSGMVLGCAADPVGWWPVAWGAIAPLWFLVGDRGWRGRSAIALAWGGGFYGVTLFWMTGIHPMTWLGVPWWPSLAIAIGCWLAITLWAGGVPVLWAIGWGAIARRLPTAGGRILAGVALWCGLEALWNQSPLWWPSLALTQSPHNLAILHLGRLSGPGAVAAAIVVVNGCWAEAARSHLARRNPSRWGLSPHHKKPWPILATGMILMLVLHGIGGAIARQPLGDTPDQALRIGLIQGNIPNEIKFGSEGWRRALAGYTSGYESLARAGAEGVLIPETALPVIWDSPQRDRSSFYRAIRDRGVPAWVGAFGIAPPATPPAPNPDRTITPSRLTNTLFVVDGQGQTVDRYSKAKLVPLGEYIPGERWIGSLINRLSPLEAQLVAGTADRAIATPLGPAILAICYDSAFANLFRTQAAAGGQFILTAANDAHYRPAMYAQHHAQDILRAIETDRWMLRATNTGYSGVVDPHGLTRWRSPAHVYLTHLATIYRRTTRSPYVRWGDWLTPLLGLLLGLTYGITRLKERVHHTSAGG